MAAHVEQIEADPPVVEQEYVEKISGQFLTRPVGPGEADRRGVWQGRGQEGLLDAGRGLQVPLQAALIAASSSVRLRNSAWARSISVRSCQTTMNAGLPPIWTALSVTSTGNTSPSSLRCSHSKRW